MGISPRALLFQSANLGRALLIRISVLDAEAVKPLCILSIGIGDCEFVPARLLPSRGRLGYYERQRLEKPVGLGAVGVGAISSH